MLKNFASDPELFTRCMNLIDGVFPGVKSMALKAIKYDACWDKKSTPFIIEENGEIVAHLGVMSLEIMLNQKNRRVAALHGICTKEAFRGRGLFKQLMQEAMKYIENNFDTAILFTDQPSLYVPYRFSVLPEYDFIIDSLNIKKVPSDFRLLSFDNKNDLSVIQELLSHSLLLSNQMSLVNESTLFILNNLTHKLYYSQQLHAVIIFEINEQCLFIKDILSPKQLPIDVIVSMMHGDYAKVILQFFPDKYTNHTYTPILAQPDGNIMVLNNFNYEGQFFRYPESYRC